MLDSIKHIHPHVLFPFTIHLCGHRLYHPRAIPRSSCKPIAVSLIVAFVIQWSWCIFCVLPCLSGCRNGSPFPYIEPREYPNELFNQAIRCMKADIVRKPPRRELSGRDARETGDWMDEVAGRQKCYAYSTNNRPNYHLYFVQLVNNSHPSEIHHSHGFSIWLTFVVPKSIAFSYRTIPLFTFSSLRCCPWLFPTPSAGRKEFLHNSVASWRMLPAFETACPCSYARRSPQNRPAHPSTIFGYTCREKSLSLPPRNRR